MASRVATNGPRLIIIRHLPMKTLTIAKRLAVVLLALALVGVVFSGALPTAEAQTASGYFYDVRWLETAAFGVTTPGGIAFVRPSNSFLVLGMPNAGKASADLAIMPFYERPITSPKTTAITDPLNF